MGEFPPVLAEGTELGPYVVEARLGAGGMGEVYRARDKRLRRTVALKVLPAHLAKSSGLRQRLEREAETISSLNHPHICTLHDIGRHGEIDFLVMEFLEGETLAQRLKGGALTIVEVLEFAIQICAALDAAHAKGIIHRDIKPANVFIVGRGQVKVLDFGLAKVAHSAPSLQSETASFAAELTAAGMVVGTIAYMSPEQVRGEEVDTRTDLFSFGVVLYEMATGTRPFRGNSTMLVADAILQAHPAPVCNLKAELPSALEQIVQTALEKDRELRVQTAAEMRAALLRLKRDLQSPAEAPRMNSTGGSPPGSPTRRTAVVALASGVAGVTAMGLFGINRRSGSVTRRLTRLSIALPDGFVSEASANKRVAISADGARVAYTISAQGQGQALGSNKFYFRSLDALEPKVLNVSGGTPFFSPDGGWIGFFGLGPDTRPNLRKVSVSGGAPVTLCATEAFAGGTWADNDTIYFVASSPGPLMSIPSAGGQPKQAAKIDIDKGERLHKFPCAIPGSRAVLFTLSTREAESFDDARIAVVDTKSGVQKILIEGGTHPRYSPSGHLIYARSGNLIAVRFDPDRLAVIGQPFTALEGVVMSVNSGVANYDISASGDLIYVPGVADKALRTLVWVDRNGSAEPVSSLPARAYLHPRLAPDDRQLAIEVEGSNHDFYTYDFTRAVFSKMTTDGESHWPVWSPDGGRIVFRTGRMMAFRMEMMPADRSRPPEPLPGEGRSQNAESWAPDGHAIAYTATTEQAGSHIMVASLEGDRKSQRFLDINAPAGSPKFSPDGKWLAYCSNESGKAQVYVQAYPGPGARIQVSNDGGTDPVWKRTGGELYFRDGDKMMAVAVSTSPTFSSGRPRMLWQSRYSHGMSTSCGPAGATSSNYDVTADGKRFLMIKDEAPDTALSKQIVVVLGWADELRRLNPG